MSKIDEALQGIAQVQDTTERALGVAGLVSTLLRIKNIQPVLVGQIAYECYAQASDTQPPVDLQVKTPFAPVRVIHEVMAGMLDAEGFLWEWRLCGVPIRFLGHHLSADLEMCRDVPTDFGVVSLIPAEELMADLVVASSVPRPDAECLARAKRLIALALTDVFEVDWKRLREIADGDVYRVGEKVAELRQLTKAEIDEASGGYVPPADIGQPPAPAPQPNPEAEGAGEAAAAEAAGITPPATKPRIHRETADAAPRPAEVHGSEAADVPSTKKETARLVSSSDSA